MDATLAGFWHAWTNRAGPYRPESRMPSPLALLIRRPRVDKGRPRKRQSLKANGLASGYNWHCALKMGQQRGNLR